MIRLLYTSGAIAPLYRIWESLSRIQAPARPSLTLLIRVLFYNSASHAFDPVCAFPARFHLRPGPTARAIRAAPAGARREVLSALRLQQRAGAGCAQRAAASRTRLAHEIDDGVSQFRRAEEESDPGRSDRDRFGA